MIILHTALTDLDAEIIEFLYRRIEDVEDLDIMK